MQKALSFCLVLLSLRRPCMVCCRVKSIAGMIKCSSAWQTHYSLWIQWVQAAVAQRLTLPLAMWPQMDVPIKTLPPQPTHYSLAPSLPPSPFPTPVHSPSHCTISCVHTAHLLHPPQGGKGEIWMTFSSSTFVTSSIPLFFSLALLSESFVLPCINSLVNFHVCQCFLHILHAKGILVAWRVV